MKRAGTVEAVREVEDLLKTLKGTRVKNTTGNRGDYESLGVTDPSSVHTEQLTMAVFLQATFIYDERTGKAFVSIKDDNLGRLVSKCPGLMDKLGNMTVVGNGHHQ